MIMDCLLPAPGVLVRFQVESDVLTDVHQRRKGKGLLVGELEPIFGLSAYRTARFEALTDPDQHGHKMPVDSPQNGVAFVLVVLDSIKMGSSSQIKDIAM